jgi:hypothetical protein
LSLAPLKKVVLTPVPVPVLAKSATVLNTGTGLAVPPVLKKCLKISFFSIWLCAFRS